MTGRVADILGQRAAEGLIGRERELATLLTLLEEGGPLIVHVHGIAGIGKSALLEAFAARARARGATVLQFDCRAVEPVEKVVLRHLGSAIGGDPATLEEAADRLGALSSQVVLTLDTYEVFRTMDAWLRQTMVPALPANVRLLLAGREPPAPGWVTTPGWAGLFRGLILGPLDEESAIALLERSGIGEAGARQVNRVARGHPLALHLVAARAVEHPERSLDDVAASSVVEDLTRLYLSEIPDQRTRETLEAASVVRRVTVPLLHAMLPDAAPQDAVERLRSLAFVESGWDGLHVHDAVQQAIAAGLRANDPVRYRGYRRAAWRRLRSEVAGAGRSELWRYTADMLYLLENPIVREAFFPSGGQLFSVEPAESRDRDGIRAVSARHEPVEATDLLMRWWEQAPQTFWVVREHGGEVVGFFCPFASDSVSPRLVQEHPILSRWAAHLRREPVSRGQRVLFYPPWLSRDHDEAFSPVQGATWLEMKRQYMEMRPDLRRVYIAQRDLETQGPALQQLGFRRIPEADVVIGNAVYRTAMLDFGPASVDGWLARLVAAELGMEEDELLDRSAHELVVAGRRVPLTRLEFQVMEYLSERTGAAVSRQSLINDVWGYQYQGGSNVVDVVIRSLRKKLGTQSGLIETATGVGYRLKRVEGNTANDSDGARG